MVGTFCSFHVLIATLEKIQHLRPCILTQQTTGGVGTLLRNICAGSEPVSKSGSRRLTPVMKKKTCFTQARVKIGSRLKEVNNGCTLLLFLLDEEEQKKQIKLHVCLLKCLWGGVL